MCAIVLYDESLHHYCSEAFESLINEEAGRKIIAKLLLKEDKKKKAQESSPKPTVSEPPLGPIEAEVDTEASEFIENVEEREKHFKTQVAIVLKQAEDLSLLKRPSHGCEVCFLVATPAKKIVSWSTPKLEPLYKSEQGQNYLKAVLTSSKDLHIIIIKSMIIVFLIFVLSFIASTTASTTNCREPKRSFRTKEGLTTCK